jgi:hypothetical protein
MTDARFAWSRLPGAANTIADWNACVQRQNFRCGKCRKRITRATATFDHWPIKRGMGAAFRDDRVELPDGDEINRAVHWNCQ